MTISFQTAEKVFRLPHKTIIKKWIISAIQEEQKIPGEVAFVFTSDDYLLEMNKTYLKHDYFTDVITFDFTIDKVINGDICISIDTVEKNAIKFEVGFLSELHRVMIHGVMHLCGYKDKRKEDKRLMSEREDYYLAQLQKFLEKEAILTSSQ